MGDEARSIGWSLDASAIDPIQIRRYVGELKAFGAVDDLISIVTGGVSGNATTTDAHIERELEYGKSP